MQTTRFTRLSGMMLAVMLTLLVGTVRADGSKLEGTWLNESKSGSTPSPPSRAPRSRRIRLPCKA